MGPLASVGAGLIDVGVGAALVIYGKTIWSFDVNNFNVAIRFFSAGDHIQIRVDPTLGEINPTLREINLNSEAKWKIIQLSSQDKQILKSLNIQQFIQKCNKYICPITCQVVKNPVAMKCCLGNKLGEKLKVQQRLQGNTQCPLCGKPGQTLQSIVYENNHILGARDGIQILRKRLQITYRKFSAQLHRQFQRSIEQYLGENYTRQQLGCLPPSQWKNVQLSQQDQENLREMTRAKFIKECKLYSCPINLTVLRDPVAMTCCYQQQLAEKADVQYWLKKNTQCPLCQKEANHQKIVFQCTSIQEGRKEIQTLRKRLQITYQKLSPQLREQFSSIISKYFGENYQIQHLGKLPPSQWKNIQLSQQDKQIYPTLTREQFTQECKLYTCPISFVILRDPVGMECCLGRRAGERAMVQQSLQTNTKCPLCGEIIQSPEPIVNQCNYIREVLNGVQMIRKRLQITYKDLTGSTREQFKQVICLEFGENYIEQHLTCVQ